MELVETLLPGVGVRYELPTESGLHLVFVVHRDGSVELSTYPRNDADRALSVVKLSAAEALTVAGVLGAPQLVERFADLSREVPGLQSARFALHSTSPHVDLPLGATQARTRTGCSIVAIVRGDDVVTSPGPDEIMREGDVLVVIGSERGLQRMSALLVNGA
ncbi:cation:proton antiporter regulatory subunit [Janibacter sp. GS2]|uniref:cation:proton antiporter regulatory subunit n=1 Tax=Janibacter sp. GS2 TaxID=3442646 RepID=UPI003EBEB227